MPAEMNTLTTDREIRWDPPHRTPANDSAPPPAGWYLSLKASIDFTLALVLFVLTLPLMLFLTLLVRLTSRGPAFYSQTRLGLNGRPYPIYKLRTMRHNCEMISGAKWSTKGDPRITPLGRVLRKTHLDELPQLWNVLKGDMSLVGPRPERPEFVPELEKKIPDYRERLQVRPGVTGLAQIQLEADTDIESVRRKLVYDLYYIRNMSVWLDLRIVLSTGLKVFHVPFAVSRLLFRMPSVETVEQKDRPEDGPTRVRPEEPRLQPEAI